jgi:hypothetical protein
VAPPWTEDFDFYEGRMGDDRVMVLIDLAANRHAPLPSHPIRLQVRVAMLQPRLDGLRSDEEKDALFALEDRVVPALQQAADAIFVARVVGQGYTELIFHVPPERRAVADDAGSAVGALPPYQLEWLTEEDPAWALYGELYPNAYAIQTIWNRRLVEQMKRHGDQLQLSRVVDHLVVFPAQEPAVKAAEVLASRGFQVDPPRHDDGWRLQFHRRDSCDGDRPDQFTFEILDLVLPLGGAYDGWGSAMVVGQA